MNKLVNDCIKLGFGLMRLPRLENGSIDIEQTSRMTDAFLAAVAAVRGSAAP
jgi:predicted aldo/keto reductase-like oxidoreductase